MKGVWQDHGRIKQESNSSEYQKIISVVTEITTNYDWNEGREWQWVNQEMEVWVVDYVVWWPGIQRLGGGKRRGELLGTSSETHSVILDAFPISMSIGRGSKTSYSGRDNRNSMYDSCKCCSVLHFKDEEVIFNFLQIHSYVIMKNFTVQNVNRY